ncbi:beta-ketoacyl synthase N-terminal-like domain-containing protein [Saccharothrix coeruleofusca]|uniref:3-oxoacyl-ACP synthase n=1 Tax=Saccharothrix coeruleofusca TaxID=33919 RepID=A0A918AV81_9PSEU|nr:beta-ketoacyl synthase N-terminal-like domain-containing protein [Saccharothrix coeruleofusca]MBP2335545.1 3-oxoacyl-[acyl-carrier-protein] synthase II [Saccharothrix coeruleofusca]GGP79867.1 3-oxoacyl-ACP synthase [Saccharothrix coeruleofusca]
MSATVITGLGLVTPFGRGLDVFWTALRAGRSALAPPRRFAAPPHEGEAVGEVPTDAVAGVPRKQAYLDAAVVEALSSAGLARLPESAVVVLTGQAPGHEAGFGADWAEFVGPPVQPHEAGNTALLTHACASAVFGLGFARDVIDAGLADVVLVAGGTALNHYEYASMRAVRAISTTPARPFDRGRSGISLGEGGGAIVLEAEDHAARRGAATDLVVAGTCCRVGTGKPTASDPALIQDCVEAALADAGLDRLDHVHAHATGTTQGDSAELTALEAVAAGLGLHDLPVSSHKGAIGHLLHTSGFPAIAAAAMALRIGEAPPTAGLTDPEPTRRLRLAPGAIPTTGRRVAAVTSFGFGSNNGTAVLTREH